MHDVQCWAQFEARYREAFFALDPAQGFHVRYRYDNSDYLSRCEPPASLAGLLPGFQVPTMPISEAVQLAGEAPVV